MGADSTPRRSAQTAAYLILHALVRWMTPILAFTAEEIWQEAPKNETDAKLEFALLATWSEELFSLNDSDAINDSDWSAIFQVREAVAKQLEPLRSARDIGSSLDAEVTIFCNGTTLKSLQKLGDELRFVTITSAANVEPLANKAIDAVEAADIPDVWIQAKSSSAEKCVRCWHHQTDVGANNEHPELCGRCVSNLSDNGEERLYA